MNKYHMFRFQPEDDLDIEVLFSLSREIMSLGIQVWIEQAHLDEKGLFYQNIVLSVPSADIFEQAKTKLEKLFGSVEWIRLEEYTPNVREFSEFPSTGIVDVQSMINLGIRRNNEKKASEG